VCLLAIRSTASAAELVPGALRCEYSVNPLGIDAARPRLSWVLQSTQRGQAQTAYRVRTASRPEHLREDKPDLWDTGKVTSSQSIGVRYGGKKLNAGERVYWQVRVWDRNDRPSAYSHVAWWEMALLSADDWTGKWICRNRPLPRRDEDFYGDHPAPVFRKEFALGKPIRRARAYVSGLGYYELSLNGRRVGDSVLDPGWTSYAKRVLYSTYDVTELLREGRNAVSAQVGNGWYNPLPMRMWGRFNLREALTVGRPRLIVQLNVEYEDGTRESVVTDGTWRVTGGPIVRNSVYLGERYDARREVPGCDMPGFNAHGWPAAVAADEPVGPLRAQSAPPIRVTRVIEPVKLTEPKPGVFVFDLGQNFAGWPELAVEGPAGTEISLTGGELLREDGTVNVMTTLAGQIKRPGMAGPGAPSMALQRDVYITKGEGKEVYRPRFTFHGFRYVEVDGYPGRPTLDSLRGIRLNADVRRAGRFSCSNPMFNRIQEMFEWTLLSNLFSVQSDCPHREKFGYGDDLVASSESVIFNFDMATFYEKTARDFADAVRANGGFPETAPYVGIATRGMGDGSGPICCGTAHPLLQIHLLQYYGSRELVEEQYEATRRWIEAIRANVEDGILVNDLGDYESIAPKSPAVSGTAFYCWNLRLAQRLAGVLGREDDALRYRRMADAARDVFNDKFLDRASGKYESGTQANQAIPLYLNLVPDAHRDMAFDAMVDDVLTKHDGHLTTGIRGTPYMLEVLSDRGRADVAYTIANQKTFPGWGYMIERGATTIWEHWAYSDNTYSHNHPMFGSISGWFFRSLAGIRPAPDAIGLDRIVIRPRLVDDLQWVKASYDSVRGTIRSDWERTGDGLEMTVAVPVGTMALVHVPASEPARVRESGKPANEAEGVRWVATRDGAVVFAVESGTYRFVVAPAAQAPRQTDDPSQPSAFPGKRTAWHGYDRYDFELDGRSAIVVTPKQVAPGKPWIWRARFFGDPPGADPVLLSKGFHLVHIDVADLFGNPQAVGHWNAFYKFLTEKHGLARKPAVEGFSRGGLILYNWAAANPDKVACIYADAPVCDIKSWPGGLGKGSGNAQSWPLCLKAWNLTPEQTRTFKGNPIDHLEPIAKAGVPLLHVCGGADRGVPLDENTRVLEQRYKKLGGKIDVIVKPDCGHQPHGLKDPAPIIEFILKHTGHLESE